MLPAVARTRRNRARILPRIRSGRDRGRDARCRPQKAFTRCPTLPARRRSIRAPGRNGRCAPVRRRGRRHTAWTRTGEHGPAPDRPRASSAWLATGSRPLPLVRVCLDADPRRAGPASGSSSPDIRERRFLPLTIDREPGAAFGPPKRPRSIRESSGRCEGAGAGGLRRRTRPPGRSPRTGASAGSRRPPA